MKLAVVFPGVGYHIDRPILHYASKIAKKQGYEIISLSYDDLPVVDKKDPMSMKYIFDAAYAQVVESLRDVDWDSYEDVVFLCKSIGTPLGVEFAGRSNLKARLVLYTPLEVAFREAGDKLAYWNAIAFHGTKDHWSDLGKIKDLSAMRKVPLHLYEGADHSLETGDVMVDLENMSKIMKLTEEFITQK